MSKIFGTLGFNDTDRAFIEKAGQRVVYDLIQQYMAQWNAEVNAAMSVFVEGTTGDYKLRYKLPSSGYMQLLADDARPGSVKATGGWDVAYPLRSYGDAISVGWVTKAYMTPAEMERNILTVQADALNTLRFEMLKAMFNNTERTFIDRIQGTLLIEPFANGDANVYPPVLGSVTEATENHYLGSAYTAASISDTNDPIVTLTAELEEHFGAPTGGSNIAVFCNNAQTAKIMGLTAFTELGARFINLGANVNNVTGVPPELLANNAFKVLGYHAAGAWIAEWRWVPAGYLLAVHLDAPKPLMKRVDPPDVGLGNGDLMLVAQDMDHPIETSFYSLRFGFGVGNRLNGVVMDLSNADSDWDTPAAYA